MKIISALVLTLGIAAPALASDFTDLQNLNAAGISKINPFPNPSNPDSCYLTGLKDGLCSFKCRSGETFQIKPVKPQAASVYEQCGGGDYRSADKSVTAEQTYNSYGKYPSAAKASEVMTWAANGFKFAKTEVVNQTIVVHGLVDYRFRLTYKAAAPLSIESSPVFRVELDAYQRMFDMADRLENDGATVVTHEVASYEGGYYYVIGYFQAPRGADRQADKKVRACVLNGYANNVCNYKCNDGSVYTQPLMTPGPWNNNPVILCPQLVFPF